MLLLEQGTTNRAVALDSVTLVSGRFPIVSTQNLSSDQRTRVIIFASNLELAPAEVAASVTVQAQDSLGRTYTLPVESVRKVLNFSTLTQAVVRLPDTLANTGDVWVSISFRGATSNKALISIE